VKFARVLIAALATLSASCRSPKAPSLLACELNNTGSISFGNRSTSTTYNIVWDGVQIVSGLAPGVTSPPRDEAAGVAHTLIFRDTLNRSGRGCAQSTPILIKCQSQTLTCSF
jgi:hypothetical protein